MKAFLRHYRQSPRKVRLVARLIRGKQVDEALQNLQFLPKRAGKPIQKLLASAVANAANNFGADRETLFVKDVRVDEGTVMKRYMPRAFGRASVIKKRSSKISLSLETRAGNSPQRAKAIPSSAMAKTKQAAHA